MSVTDMKKLVYEAKHGDERAKQKYFDGFFLTLSS